MCCEAGKFFLWPCQVHFAHWRLVSFTNDLINTLRLILFGILRVVFSLCFVTFRVLIYSTISFRLALWCLHPSLCKTFACRSLFLKNFSFKRKKKKEEEQEYKPSFVWLISISITSIETLYLYFLLPNTKFVFSIVVITLKSYFPS